MHMRDLHTAVPMRQHANQELSGFKEMGNMNWDDYRYFLSVARTGRLSQAGQQLGVDHATVGRRIKALEDSSRDQPV